MQTHPPNSKDYKDDLILFLIKRELKAAKFFNELSKLGFDPTIFSMELGKAILSLIGFHTNDDELWNWYYDTLDCYVEKVDLKDDALLTELTLRFKTELQINL